MKDILIILFFRHTAVLLDICCQRMFLFSFFFFLWWQRVPHMVKCALVALSSSRHCSLLVRSRRLCSLLAPSSRRLCSCSLLVPSRRLCSLLVSVLVESTGQSSWLSWQQNTSHTTLTSTGWAEKLTTHTCPGDLSTLMWVCSDNSTFPEYYSHVWWRIGVSRKLLPGNFCTFAKISGKFAKALKMTFLG